MSDSTAISDSAATGDQATRIALVEDDHAGELLTLRRAAFVSEAQVYGDPNIPPLTQTMPELREDMARDDVVTIGAWEGHRLVGSIRVEIDGGRATLGRLAVAPDQQGRGLGTTLLFAILEFLPQEISEIWAFTGSDSPHNLAMYTKNGYEAQYDEAAGELTYTYLRRVLHEVDARSARQASAGSSTDGS